MGSMTTQQAMGYSINLERVKQDIYTIGRFGYNSEDQGIYGQGFSEDDIKVRMWFLLQLAALNLKHYMHGQGNVIRLYGHEGDKELLIGQNLASAPAGGMLECVLGGISGLA